jgi:predicted site-specific integrase-resolvase
MPSGSIIIEDDAPKLEQKIVIYTRVSSSENKANLEKQGDRLISYCNAKGWKVEKVIKEVGSGLNDNRKQLEKLLMDKTITTIVVEHSDRFCRFGMNYIQKLMEMQGRKIEIVNKQSNDWDDLMQDFVSIITSFTARLYGQRRTKRMTEQLIKELETPE